MVKSQLIYLLEKIHVIYHMDVVQDGRLQDTPPPHPPAQRQRWSEGVLGHETSEPKPSIDQPASNT